LGPLGVREYSQTPKYTPAPVLVHAALRSCAAGLLGEDALQIYQLVEVRGSPQHVNERSGRPSKMDGTVADTARNAEAVVTALASSRCIQALVPFVQHLRSGNKPLALSHSLHTACLASALFAGDEESTLYFLRMRHDEELHRILTKEETEVLLSKALSSVSKTFQPTPEVEEEVAAFAARFITE
jgi:hypothetical protein